MVTNVLGAIWALRPLIWGFHLHACRRETWHRKPGQPAARLTVLPGHGTWWRPLRSDGGAEIQLCQGSARPVPAPRLGHNNRKFDAACFDMDGTLDDSEPIHCLAYRKVLERFGKTAQR